MPTIAYHDSTTPKTKKPVPEPSTLEEISALAGKNQDDDDLHVEVQEPPAQSGVVVDDDEVVIEDDAPVVPPEDEGKPVAALDSSYDEEDQTIEEELKQINANSPNAAKRIRALTRQRHDERRAKEEQARAREVESKRANEATAYARSMYELNQRLAKQIEDLGKSDVTQRKESAEEKVKSAKSAYRDALESGDAEAITLANAELQKALIAETLASGAQPAQPERPPAPPTMQQIQPKTAAWIERNNEWFQKDPELTQQALAFHRIAVSKKGLTPETDAYYTYLDNHMKPLLDAHGLAPATSTGKTNPPKKKTVSDTVTPVSRSTSSAPNQPERSSNKVTLTASQAAMAREIMPDISPNEAYKRYAKELLAQRHQA